MADKSILVVDDDHALRQLVGSALKRNGFDVTLAANGRLGVEQLRTSPESFSAVIMDHHMPELDGVSACRAMRRWAPSTPIIMMSTDKLAQVTREAGANEFLPKPFAIEDLIDCVSRYTDNSS